MFDRAYTPYDEFIPKLTKFEFSESNVTFQDRVPPWYVYLFLYMAGFSKVPFLGNIVLQNKRN